MCVCIQLDFLNRFLYLHAAWPDVLVGHLRICRVACVVSVLSHQKLTLVTAWFRYHCLYILKIIVCVLTDIICS